MKGWQIDLLHIAEESRCEFEVYRRMEAAARDLGFDHCAYGLRCFFPISNPKTVLLNNYPESWRDRYVREDYVSIDPTVLHGRRSQDPLVWTESLFSSSSSRRLWEEARSFGLRVGWAQSCLDAFGVGGMLTLSRASEEITPAEIEGKEMRMRWLVSISHMALSRIFSAKSMPPQKIALTPREVEVLRWTADGKTSGEISDLLSVSENTVNFHIKNSIAKLGTANKTAAVVRAALLGLLH